MKKENRAAKLRRNVRGMERRRVPDAYIDHYSIDVKDKPDPSLAVI